jgi:putative lipoic acid-binding regulatory protein
MEKTMSEISEEESLIKFPCTFPIKVAGVNVPEFYTAVCAIAKKYDVSFSEDGIKSKQSKTGKYRSLTIDLYVTERSTLDSVYQALTDCELVKWAL